ncbi:MAG: hypothetical protein C4346_02670 [Chloroflexota bacterium]
MSVCAAIGLRGSVEPSNAEEPIRARVVDDTTTLRSSRDVALESLLPCQPAMRPLVVVRE